jgi:hypothetical protein
MAPRRSGRPADPPIMTPMSDESVDGDNPQHQPQTTAAGTIQFPPELIQQLREQITNEIRAQLLPKVPTVPTPSVYIDEIREEREHIRKLAKDRLSTKPIQLLGRENYIKWRESMISDAHLIDATHILEENQESSPYEANSIDTARWQKQDEVLHTRLVQSMSPTIKSTINWRNFQSTAALWTRINKIYGISSAEERLMIVKDLLDLHPQGDYVSMLLDFQRLISQLEIIDMSFSDFYHDYLICLLGQWQQQFVRTKLDEFYACGRGPIQNIDI